MSSFDLVVVGSGGGPDDTNLSAYLCKPHDIDWENGVLALEAGSAQGVVRKLLRKNPLLFRDSHHDAKNKVYTAQDIYSFVRCFLITHAHLDHVNGLILSAGSFRGPRKRIYATKQTLEDLESVFSGRIWPNLASWDEADDGHKLLYSPLHNNGKYKRIHPDVSVRTISISHGRNESGNYDSSAFFVRHDTTGREFLFFGDVEPDSVAESPQTIKVWRAVAPKIPDILSTLFIECSWPSGRKDDMLYGHLNPEHLVEELTVLATEVVLSRRGQQTNDGGIRFSPLRKKQRRNPPVSEDLHGALNGVRVYITHCKEDMADDCGAPIRHLISKQVKALVESRKLGAEILLAEQGMRIEL